MVKCIYHVFMQIFIYSSASSHCQVFLVGMECPALSAPVNGNFYIILNGNAAIFTCNSGFTVLGKSYLECKNGKWTSPPPKCLAVG